jgi:hypothetical protein
MQHIEALVPFSAEHLSEGDASFSAVALRAVAGLGHNNAFSQDLLALAASLEPPTTSHPESGLRSPPPLLKN